MARKENESNRLFEDEKVIEIEIERLRSFKDHPFKVTDDKEMHLLTESIKQYGVLNPLIVRPVPDGVYEIISGHRRKYAAQQLGYRKVPVIIRVMNDEEAIIKMVDANLQRERISYSEKAFAYKLKLDAIKHQGERNDLTSAPMEQKLDARDVVAKEVKESREQVRRYIRLTELIPKFLEMVDNECLKQSPSMAFRPAVEISYLTKEEQNDLLDIMECYDCTPSLSQAIRLKKLSQDGKLTIDDMEELMEEEKPNQTPKLKVSMNRLSNVLPSSLKNDREREEYVIKAVEWYDKYQKRLKERNSQER